MLWHTATASVGVVKVASSDVGHVASPNAHHKHSVMGLIPIPLSAG